MGDWRAFPLGELARIYDGPHATPPKTEAGPIFLGIANLSNGRLDLSSTAHVSEDDFRRWVRRITPSTDDLVFSYETRLGEAALVPRNLRCCLGRRMGLLRANRDRVDPRLLLYAYLGPEFQETLRARTVRGSTVDRIPLNQMADFPIRIPVDLDEQRAIAHVLGALDDKIDLNRRMSETLEAMARALFRSWFVDFDPVRARMEGRDPGLPDGIADLFPDSFVDSEAGEIPTGWKSGVLGDISEHQRRTVRAEEIDATTPYIALGHMPRRSICLSDWALAQGIASGKYRFREGEILFGKLRPYFHKVGVAPLDGVCSTDIVVIAPSAPEWSSYVLLQVSSDEFVRYTDAGSAGTKMPRTSWEQMRRYEIVIPPQEVVEAFGWFVGPVIRRILAGVHENRTLAITRDALLPKLISGDLRVAHIEDVA